MRGKRSAQVDEFVPVRIIPARAGQTSGFTVVSVREPDHPRACGANRYGKLAIGPGGGSSPRVRGKLRALQTITWKKRIIPARAGQTRGQRTYSLGGSDHPRACGANVQTVTPRSNMPGSSPRVRGKRLCRTVERTRRRIIPARAGQTLWSHRRPPYPTDHPRACGANAMLKNGAYTGNGSSPRVRGKRRRPRAGTHPKRIIPARAGQTG